MCTDGSSYAQVCSVYAAWIAKRCKSDIDAVYVTDYHKFELPLVMDLSGSLGVQPYQDAISHLKDIEVKKATFIEENLRTYFSEQCPESEINFHYRKGTLVDCLSDFEDSVDLVMLGKRGANAENAIGHLGSTMERVLRASHMPCLVTSRSFHEIKKL